MGRRESRERLFSIVFEMSFKESEELSAVIERLKEEGCDEPYVKDGAVGIFENIGYIDEKISEFAKQWKIERLSKVSLSVMRVAAYEMLYASLPYQVAINEAVNLAKKFDDDKAPAFINGVLNKIAEAEGLKDKA